MIISDGKLFERKRKLLQRNFDPETGVGKRKTTYFISLSAISVYFRFENNTEKERRRVGSLNDVQMHIDCLQIFLYP